MSAATLTKRIVNAVQPATPSGAALPRGQRPYVKKSGKAQILTPEMLNHLLHHIQATSRDPLRDYAIVLFSFKAGLRRAEIAGLSWGDVTDPRGKVGKPRRNTATGEVEPYLEVPNGIAKYGHGRAIPLHPALQATLAHLQQQLGPAATLPMDPVIRGTRSARISPEALGMYLKDVYLRAGLQGCSSHSGRRTAITELAQIANKHGCSLFDVQAFAGHAFISTTAPYVEPSPHVGKMVRAL